MKKVFVFLTVATMISLCSQMDAKHYAKYSKVDMGDCPIPCCEKQEMITIRKPAQMCCGYVCPDDTVETNNE